MCASASLGGGAAWAACMLRSGFTPRLLCTVCTTTFASLASCLIVWRSESYGVEHVLRAVMFLGETEYNSNEKVLCKDVHGAGCKDCKSCHFCRWVMVF